MGIVSTTDRKEALKTGKIYLDREFYINLPKKNTIPKRCKECRTELKDGMAYGYTRNGYCSDWCKEQYHLHEPIVEHVCKKCGEGVEPFRRYSSGYYVSSGVYPKYCKLCSPYGKRFNNKA